MKDRLQHALSKTQVTSHEGVERILEKKLKDLPSLEHTGSSWSTESYGLENVKLLHKLNTEQKAQLLNDLAYERFLEAYYIEKAGMNFAAKMSLLSESLHEQKLYSLFASEEARHFHMVEKAMGSPPTEEGGPFIDLLYEIIRTAERRPLIFIIQVILEGWGLDHYKLMKETCLNPVLRDYFQMILLDEAAHHGSGLALFNESELTKDETQYIEEMLFQFLNMVRIGPIGMVQSIDKNLDGLTSRQRISLLEEMNAYQETQRKLELLKNLMRKAQSHKILNTLEAKGAFALAF